MRSRETLERGFIEVAAGLVTGIVAIVASIGAGGLLFASRLPEYLPSSIGLALFSTAVFALVSAIAPATSRTTIGLIQSVPAVALSGVLLAVASAVPPGAGARRAPCHGDGCAGARHRLHRADDAGARLAAPRHRHPLHPFPGDRRLSRRNWLAGDDGRPRHHPRPPPRPRTPCCTSPPDAPSHLAAGFAFIAASRRGTALLEAPAGASVADRGRDCRSSTSPASPSNVSTAIAARRRLADRTSTKAVDLWPAIHPADLAQVDWRAIARRRHRASHHGDRFDHRAPDERDWHRDGHAPRPRHRRRAALRRRS